jgi:hypothetical protein
MDDLQARMRKNAKIAVSNQAIAHLHFTLSTVPQLPEAREKLKASLLYRPQT